MCQRLRRIHAPLRGRELPAPAGLQTAVLPRAAPDMITDRLMQGRRDRFPLIAILIGFLREEGLPCPMDGQ